ncbi:MAG: hypothetical protein IKN57_04760 [Parasporobacterium sp.]|nr:hypothetical protein [Parasporobacterium sp.]
MGRQKQESQCRVIDLEKYQNLKAYYKRREEERTKIDAMVSVEAIMALRSIDDIDHDYVAGLLTEYIRNIGELYSEKPGRSLAVKPDLYKKRADIAAELKIKAMES